jgi:hypothetical protein
VVRWWIIVNVAKAILKESKAATAELPCVPVIRHMPHKKQYWSQRRTLLKGNTLKKISLSGHAIMVGKVGSYKEHRQHSGVQGLFLKCLWKKIKFTMNFLLLVWERKLVLCRWYVLLVINSSRIYILREWLQRKSLCHSKTRREIESVKHGRHCEHAQIILFILHDLTKIINRLPRPCFKMT